MITDLTDKPGSNPVARTTRPTPPIGTLVTYRVVGLGMASQCFRENSVHSQATLSQSLMFLAEPTHFHSHGCRTFDSLPQIPFEAWKVGLQCCPPISLTLCFEAMISAFILSRILPYLSIHFLISIRMSVMSVSRLSILTVRSCIMSGTVRIV